ncbi:MAG TPA: DinB family protein [Mucilaginibacter sp.]
MKNQISNTLPQPMTVQLDSVATGFLDVVNSFAIADFNRVPFEGSWSAAEVAEHIRLSVTGTIETISAGTGVTERAPDQYVGAIKGIFLDYDAKYPSAQTLIPVKKEYDKAELQAGLKNVLARLQALVESADLTNTCLSPKFTGIGQLTQLEWLSVAVYHTQRHIHQLENIREQL